MSGPRGPAEVLQEKQIRGSIVVSISARHAEDPGSIPGRGVLTLSSAAQNTQKGTSLRPHTEVLL